MSARNISVLFNRHPEHTARVRLRLRGYFPRLGPVGSLPTMEQTEGEIMRALHSLDAVCLYLVGKFIVRPLLALREWMRPRAAAGEFMATTAEPLAHETMLGLFAVPGVRWALALVMRGHNGQATSILAARVVRLDAEQVAAARSRGEQARMARARGSVMRLASLALACGGRL